MTETPHQKLARLASEIRELVETEKRQQQAQRRAIVVAGGKSQLVALDPFPETISRELADWFLTAVDQCVAGGADLDKALGLKKGRGAPRRTGPQATPRYKRAKKAVELRRYEGRSWSEAATILGVDDVRDLQKDVARYQADIVEELSGELITLLKQPDDTGAK
jgi:hypothetical protein